MVVDAEQHGAPRPRRGAEVHRGLAAVRADLEEWAETREALDDYRPLMEFEAIEMLLRRQIELDILQELGFSIPGPT